MRNHLHSMRSKELVLIIILMLEILFFVMCITAIFSQTAVHAGSSMKEQSTERYKSIRIEPGESLWEISRHYYSENYKSVNLYMKRIMQLNNMSDEDINSGAYLLIPYYD